MADLVGLGGSWSAALISERSADTVGVLGGLELADTEPAMGRG
jgi:hypothetical protein